MAKAKAIIGAIAALLIGAAMGQAEAASVQKIDYSNAAFIKATDTTSIPYAALDFCHKDPRACAPNARVVQSVTLTASLWQQLVQVNAYYNANIVPTTDMDQYHVADLWTYPDSGYGDCEDIQLAKQRALEQLGWPTSTLLMTVVRDQNGEGHAVLMVRTDRGDLILDNEEGLIKRWDETPYQYLKRQSQADPADWLTLVDTHSGMRLAHR